MTATSRIEGTKEKIMAAAFDEFSDHGFAGATTKEIARKAGVNEVTIFRHFGTKEGLFSAVIEKKTKDLTKAVQLNLEPSEDVVADLTKFGITLQMNMTSNAKMVKLITIEVNKHHPMIWKPIASSYLDSVDALSGYFYKAMEKGLIREINADIAAVMFFSFFYRNMMSYAFRKGDSLYQMDRGSIGKYVLLFVNGFLGDERRYDEKSGKY
jgi:AcrR family transcriptional regulator